MTEGKTLFDKVWDAHVVETAADAPDIVQIDLHLLHDGTFAKAFKVLKDRGLQVWRPERAVGVTDHCIPVTGRTGMAADKMLPVVSELIRAGLEHGIEVYGPDDARQGIVHVIAPELGLTLPGRTIVCGDSHTPTLGAFGTLAFAIGTTQIAHSLATQCVLIDRPRNMKIELTGTLSEGVSAKDLILTVLAEHGVTAGKGYAIEFCGSAVAAMSMEARMTLCNMAAEMGARTAVIAPDGKTLDYLHGRPNAPARGSAFDAAAERWLGLASDPDAVFDRVVTLDASRVVPMVTYGTSPDTALPVSGHVPVPETEAARAALRYMQLAPGMAMADLKVQRVFIGSCTNARIEDLRAAVRVLRGRRIARGVALQVVPGSAAVVRQAEIEGLGDVFRLAGATWGEPGCGLCVCMNGESASPGEVVASTSNRNFPGRQGQGTRTILMSPATAAATALAGRVADPRSYLAMEDA